MNAPLRLATATLRLALSSVYRELADKLGHNIDEWSALILPESEDGLATREMSRQLASAADRVADELRLVGTSSGEQFGPDRYDAVLEAIVTALDRSVYTLVAHRNFDHLPSTLQRELLPGIEAEWDSTGTSELARLSGRSALILCCYGLLTWQRLFPTERSHAAWATLVSTTRIIDQSRSMLHEVRKSGVTGPNNALRVVGTQRRDLSLSLGQIELFGLPVERRFRRVPITISYLAGRVTQRPEVAEAKGVPFDRLIGSLPNQDQWRTSRRGIRLAIVGKAGSGKTTAVQWLAYTASQQGLQSLSLLNKPILPVFVRLRETIISGRPPSDKALLYSTQLQDEVSARWLEDCHDDVTPLILLDGWDEIGLDKRAVAEDWVRSLVSRYPKAHVILTSRFEGLPEQLIRELDFKKVTVLPLEPAAAADLATRWFSGLEEQLHASPDIEPIDVEKARRELMRDLTTPAISDMADSPLLTCMLCCLYATGNTTAPDRRGKLYDLVVSALLDARERDRGANTSDWKSLDTAKKEMLLGRIARVMAERGTMSLPINPTDANDDQNVHHIVSQNLPILGISNAEATKWTETVLARSIVLQRVADNECEFVHRSIQDYLAAKSLRHEGSLDKLFELAEYSQWTLLPFACYLADLDTADAIVNWIIDRLDHYESTLRRSLVLTLVECLSAATVVSPEIRQRANRFIQQIFPPRYEAEARSLATLGNAAIPYLRSANITNPSARTFAIETLCRIGSREAMDAIVEYARANVPTDTHAIGRAIERFDPETYAETVLTEVRSDLHLSVQDTRHLRAISNLPRVSTLVVQKARLDDGALRACWQRDQVGAGSGPVATVRGWPHRWTVGGSVRRCASLRVMRRTVAQ